MWPPVAHQTADSEEYWVGAGGRVSRLFSDESNHRIAPLGTARWIFDRLRADEQRQVTTLVEWLDDAMNNTSVVLLLEVGEHRLLFGGDAQIENWSWALNQAKSDPALATALAKVDFYKVGHHGSRNATPKSLVAMWRQRPASQKLLSMMSTKSGVHGRGERAVPRAPLVQALAELGQVVSTDGEFDFWEATAALPAGSWTVVGGNR
jgi:hypothetical protein